MKLVEVEEVVGRATVLQQFLVTEKKKVAVAGCRVQAGWLPRDGTYRLARAGEVLWEGRLADLKNLKDEVTEIVQNQEGGLRLAGADEVTFEAGHLVTCLTMRLEARPCVWDPGF